MEDFKDSRLGLFPHRIVTQMAMTPRIVTIGREMRLRRASLGRFVCDDMEASVIRPVELTDIKVDLCFFHLIALEI